ncbi:glycosyltransferase [Lichenihabitans psoromatis]|uniref:glycosyltransferase n=1 Tax=Lichenihabitans psoromatis TaxID=2528642 RepID=UPI0010383519|nr:glycosyltransferase [Lichenihabitans psoromatis]
MTARTQPVYFSICSANYLAYARTLHASLQESGVDALFVLFLVDEVAGRFDPDALGFPCIESRKLGIDTHFDMAARYTCMEMNTAIKPFCFAWLFDVAKADAAIYLDPDIRVFRPLTHVHDLLEHGSDLVLTPHSTEPLDQGDEPNDVRLLQTGVYNLGFVAFRRSQATQQFLSWWGEQLLTKCVVDLEHGLFVDQKFMDLAPAYVATTAILRHPGYNVAYWNLTHRQVDRPATDPGLWQARGEWLHFFHFSGVVRGDRTIFSKHQNRLTVETIGPVKELLFDYLKRLDAHATLDGVRLDKIPYFYGCLSNGLRFTDDMRRVYAAQRWSGPHSYERCFGTDLDLYEMLEPSVMQDAGAPVTRLGYAIWSARADVRTAYPLATAEGRRGFAAWFLSSGSLEHKIPAPLVRAAERQIAGQGREQVTNAAVSLKPGLGIYGYFRAETGVGNAARHGLRAATSAGIACRAYLLEAGASDNQVDPGMPLATGPSPFDCLLLHVNADETMRIDSLIDPGRLKGRYRIGYWAWELGQVPFEWEKAFDKVDEIWTPSRFSAKAFAARTHKPVRVMPHPVPVLPTRHLDRTAIRRRLAIPSERFAFLTAFDFKSYMARKNPLATVRAFRDAFPERDARSPILVIKCHGGDTSRHEMGSLQAAVAGDDRIVLLDAVFSPSDIADLQEACDAFVSLHRSEGFGLWIAECMARGKAVICTNYSGNTDFTSHRTVMPIGYRMVSVRSGDYPFGAGQWWADPDHGEAVAAMRAVAADVTLRRRLGDAARISIGATLSYDLIGTLMRDRLDQIRALGTCDRGLLQLADAVN